MHFILPSLEYGSRDGVPGLRIAESRSQDQIPRRPKRFLCSKVYRPSLRPTQLRIVRVPGALFSRLKRPEREANHSPPFAVKLKHEFSYTTLHLCGPGSVVGIATGYGLDGPETESRWG